ncbi:methylenetetrahydrofolate reductase [NAD(P)H] [Hoeflea prorocentri]|uniref:Methylenetetrahydrofolate reductase n=1 Tax=Hoeflea prorocentri TaxID=1922333 RepID=A0A9X3UFM7_9HYPH|nr:methylenetetrahydrofolate reductase [NAD(P)H] [Hoeflea prorocentri]MCY6379882.1 methylenetetrahydrofolate reductase [NAD(P)H] [Hoeflea prorocentri]MDA5397682.1 methylenetetrahydrofolate reductase [NAD(P)H] [Hoeflea prorocentri]
MSVLRRSGPTLLGDDMNVSFEFFPPRSGDMESQLWESVMRLAPFGPDFVSVTYGAGGTTRQPTLATVKRLLAETDLAPAAHLTCVNASKDDVDAVAREFWEAGVRHFVALRGDSPDGIGSAYRPHKDGYRNAAELVAGLKAFADFEITVSAYPEKHPESPDFMTDIDMLKRKVDNGATRAITQFFFDNDSYERYVERVRRAGIYVPIVPGILPVHNFSQVAKFADLCGASIPDWLATRFEGLEQDPQTRSLVAAAVAADQVMDLVERGVQDFHFYTMNRAQLVYAICHLLGLRAPKGNGTVTTATAA